MMSGSDDDHDSALDNTEHDDSVDTRLPDAASEKVAATADSLDENSNTLVAVGSAVAGAAAAGAILAGCAVAALTIGSYVAVSATVESIASVVAPIASEKAAAATSANDSSVGSTAEANKQDSSQEESTGLTEQNQE
jgi:hypothetical protein